MTAAVKLFNTSGVPRGIALTTRDHLVIENTLENSIHVGRRFFNEDWAAIDAAGSLNLYLEVARSSEGDYALHTDFVIEGDQENTLEIFIEPTISDKGEELTVWNNNGFYQLTNFFQSKLYKDCTPSDNGTSVIRGRISSGKKIAGSRYDFGERILVEGRKILIKIDNIDTAGYIMWQIGFSQIYSGSILQ